MLNYPSHRFLIIDSDRKFVAQLADVLDGLGYRWRDATGLEDTRLLTEGKWSGLFLGVATPDRESLKWLRAVRPLGRRIPVIITSHDPLWTEGLTGLGVVDVLLKPAGVTDLIKAVNILRSVELPPASAGSVSVLSHCAAAVIRHTDDVPNVRHWCGLVGRSESTLHALCQLSGVRAKPLLDLARLLRVSNQLSPLSLASGLANCDPRTQARLLSRAGLRPDSSSVSSEFILQHQTLVSNTHITSYLGRIVGLNRPALARPSGRLGTFPESFA